MKRISLPFSDDRIEICGNTDVYVDRCRRLLECSDMLVQLKIQGHSVSVWGKNLTATDFSAAGLHIHGEIAAVEFDGGI
ncbi:MAG: YabP/YqfC family sporulation protein [Oscillospiraceae bacterium]|nr:YabP/YqfC family sporulation protein [Oscillospiraceae bacterium]